MEVAFNPLVLAIAYAIDVCIGDPWYRIHPIVWIGRLITFLERILFAVRMRRFVGGILLWFGTSAVSLGLILGLVWVCGLIDPIVGLVVHGLFVYFFLALGDLQKHCSKVKKAALANDLAGAHDWISRLVGRDTNKMTTSDCTRAAIESGSENFCDSVVAPLFWYAIFGLPGLIVFKVTSTLDSMVGYRSARYEWFGKWSARVDDVLCFLPARITMLLYILSSIFIPSLRLLRGVRAAFMFAKRYPGFNSGWPEATAGGLLGLRLVGPIYSKGTLVNSSFIGFSDDRLEVKPHDLGRLIWLNYLSSGLFLLTLTVLNLLLK